MERLVALNVGGDYKLTARVVQEKPSTLLFRLFPWLSFLFPSNTTLHTVSFSVVPKVVSPTKAPKVVVPTVISPTKACSAPKFRLNWESFPSYPLPVAEAHGALIGSDLVLISGFTKNFGNNLTRGTYAYNTKNGLMGSWRKMDDFPTIEASTHGAFVVVQNVMYICGGYVGRHPGPATNLCWKYDHVATPGTQWSSIPSLPQPRSGGGMIYDSQQNTLLFATGSSRPNPNDLIYTIDHNDVWQLNLNKRNSGWVVKPPLPYAANHVGYATVQYGDEKERHYILGGQLGEEETSGNLDHIYEWDADTETWIERSSLLFPRGHFSSSTNGLSNGCGLIITGGAINNNNVSKTDEVHYYDIETNKWSRIGTIPSMLNTPVCSISFGYLYCESGLINNFFSWRRKLKII